MGIEMKGNRKVSLSVYGKVNQAVMFWDDGDEDNAYVVTNDSSRTRIGFKGKAKITRDWSSPPVQRSAPPDRRSSHRQNRPVRHRQRPHRTERCFSYHFHDSSSGYDLPPLSEFFPFISIPNLLLQPQRFVTNLHTTNCTLRPSIRSRIAVSQKLQREAIVRGVGLRGALP